MPWFTCRLAVQLALPGVTLVSVKTSGFLQPNAGLNTLITPETHSKYQMHAHIIQHASNYIITMHIHQS